MKAGELAIGGLLRPTILVLAVPYVAATALASNFRPLYEVVAPNLEAGETAPELRWDAVLTLGAVESEEDLSGLVIGLPDTSFKEPVTVTVNHRKTYVRVSEEHPIEDVVALLRHHLGATAF
jgi:hypothetical protein